MPFIAVDNVIGKFEANGVLGLAPSKDERSIVTQLWL
jgi:hypothetical protein